MVGLAGLEWLPPTNRPYIPRPHGTEARSSFSSGLDLDGFLFGVCKIGQLAASSRRRCDPVCEHAWDRCPTCQPFSSGNKASGWARSGRLARAIHQLRRLGLPASTHAQQLAFCGTHLLPGARELSAKQRKSPAQHRCAGHRSLETLSLELPSILPLRWTSTMGGARRLKTGLTRADLIR